MQPEKVNCSRFVRFSFGGLVIELLYIVIAIIFFYAIADHWLNNAGRWVGFETGISSFTGDDGEEIKIGNINFLVMGVDSVDGTHRADTIFVFGVNPAKKRVSMISIPRDTRVMINSKARKINEILPRYGEPVLRTLVEDLMQIQISRYIQVDFRGFVNVIDAIGGIEINIEKPMHYDDNYGKLHIHFDKGLQKLDGQKALNYVRFRADSAADLGRIKRQQKFIEAGLKKILTPAVFVKLPAIVDEVFKHIKTDVSVQEIFALARGFEDFKVKVRTASLPGEPRYIDKISYFLPYRDKAVEFGNAWFSDLAAVELVASFTPVIASQTLKVNEN
jgi:LCP family protein required for cell wall assembly